MTVSSRQIMNASAFSSRKVRKRSRGQANRRGRARIPARAGSLQDYQASQFRSFGTTPGMHHVSGSHSSHCRLRRARLRRVARKAMNASPMMPIQSIEPLVATGIQLVQRR